MIAGTANVVFATVGDHIKNPLAKKIVYIAGNQSYRGFLVMNTVLNIVNSLRQNKAFYSIGNLIDLPFLFTNVKDTFMARGLYFGIATLDKAIQKSSDHPLKPKSGQAYQSMKDSWIVMQDRMAEFFKEIFIAWPKVLSDKTASFKEKSNKIVMGSLLDEKKNTAGILGSLCCFASFALFMLGHQKTARIVGDVIGTNLIAANRLDPRNLMKGRFFEWTAQLMFSSSAIADLLKFPKLQMGLYSLGRMMMSESNRLNEVNNTQQVAIANPLIHPLTFLGQAKEKLLNSLLIRDDKVIRT